jgi:hypothetical protein
VPYDLHVVRTSNWLEAAMNPITRAAIDRLIQSDPELAWSSSDYVEMKGAEGVNHFYMIAWNGRSCFLWHQDQITCATSDEREIEKLVGIAQKLEANVLGDDGEQYSFSRNLSESERLRSFTQEECEWVDAGTLIQPLD